MASSSASHSGTSHQKPSILIRFPKEIRQEILACLIEDSANVCVMIFQQGQRGSVTQPVFKGFPAHRRDLNRLIGVERNYVDFDPTHIWDLQRYRYKGFKPVLNFALTCRALLDDAMFTLYGKARFQFLCVEDMTRFLRTCRPGLASLIHNIKVSFPLCPPVPHSLCLPAYIGVPEIELALVAMLASVKHFTSILSIDAVTYLVDNSFDDDEDDEDDTLEFIDFHRDMVKSARDHFCSLANRDVTLDHWFVSPGQLSEDDSEDDSEDNSEGGIHIHINFNEDDSEDQSDGGVDIELDLD